MSQAGNCLGHNSMLGRAFPSKHYLPYDREDEGFYEEAEPMVAKATVGKDCNEHFQDRPGHDFLKSDDEADFPYGREDEGFYKEAECMVAKAEVGKDCNEHFQDRPRHDVLKSDDEADSMFDTEDEDYSDDEPWANFTDWSDSEGLKCKEHFNDPPGSVVCCREENSILIVVKNNLYFNKDITVYRDIGKKVLTREWIFCLFC
ncbi:uncharacterized protein LOC121378310 [Gigantopelta aegis]|uniref:uncharacterized protein LOC121378310 n=1 Tax=Gigantopelta aegis TaxID=1735272 RepID=UPI001B88D972|nr:uncharacterized protein LOC121378310 [Gigantopelta aegis]